MDPDHKNNRTLWLETIFQHTSVGILITDPTKEDNPILYSNPAFSSITGYSHAEIVGKNCRFLQGLETNKETVMKIRTAIQAGKSFKGEILNYKKNGEAFWNALTINPVYNECGKLEFFVGIQNDVTKRKTLEAEFQSDLQLAKTIQGLSISPPLSNENIKISGKLLSSKQVGGDSYVWFELKPNEYGVLLMDVMGNGVPASLISMSIHSYLYYLVRNNPISPKIVIEKLNKHLFELFTIHNQIAFTTAIYLYIDLNKRSITYANAGHVDGLLTTRDNLTRLSSLSLPLGLCSTYDCRQETVSLADKPHRMVLFTDGLVESSQYNLEDAITRVENFILENMASSQEIVLDALVEEFEKERKSIDDISVVIIDL